MCQLGRLQMNASGRLAACSPGAVHTRMPQASTALSGACRHRSSHICSSQLQHHQQQWQTLSLHQHTSKPMLSCCHTAAMQMVQQQQAARLPGLHSSGSSSGPMLLPAAATLGLSSRCFSTGRSRRGSPRHAAAAHDSPTDTDSSHDSPAAAGQASVTTVEKQAGPNPQQQLEAAGSSQSTSASQQGSPQSSVDGDVAAMQPVTKAMYSPLHYDVLEFARHVVPTPSERHEKQRIIQCVAAATKRSFEDTSGIKVQAFGSFVNGLSTWNSDIDLVVTGLAKPSRITGGFSHNDKRLVYRALDKIAFNLRKHKKVAIRKLIIIRTARIPIIKLETQSLVVADISLGDNSGPKAANYIAQQVNAYPPLAPLVLVLKVYLRSCGLNEVANGGLSSFSLTNMVLAHIMEELRDGHDVYDLGETLYGFLLRFGDEFDIRTDAVSVALGGCVPRSELGHLDGGDSGAAGMGRERMLLEDPLTGRDVASGTYRISAVQMAFSKAARRLEALAQTRHASSSSSHINYLEGLFDVQRALNRDAGRRGGSAAPWGGTKGVTDEYFVIGQGGRYTGAPLDGEIEVPLEGDDYDDELEAYLYPEDRPGRGSQRKRGSR